MCQIIFDIHEITVDFEENNMISAERMKCRYINSKMGRSWSILFLL